MECHPYFLWDVVVNHLSRPTYSGFSIIYISYWTSFSPHRVTTPKCNQANGTRKELVPEITFSTSEVPFHAPVFGELLKWFWSTNTSACFKGAVF